MFVRALAILCALAGAALAAPAASANADLTTSFTVTPSPAQVYGSASYTVRVSNIGNKNASNCSVSIQLPPTHTNPQVYVLGILGSRSATCTQSGTTLTCPLATINKGTNKTVFFNIQLPVSTTPFVFTATASTTSAENSTSNNAATSTAAQTFFPTAWGAGPVDVTNSHCTGIGLTSWYECTLFSGAVTTHATTLLAGGGISFPAAPGYTGMWSTTADSLHFEYYDGGGATVAIFDGQGTTADCYEGLTLFPGSSYVAPYKVCR
ncbi:MAG: CARDB domain-containing protein [Myxococcota bacterium]